MQTILMPIDFSDVTERMADYVAGLCPKLDAEVCVLHVSGADLDDPKQGRAVLAPKIDKIVSRLEAAGCKASAKLVFGPAITTIIDQLDLLKPAMVVVGSHGHGALHDLVVGSVTQSLLRSCPCPVLVVPAQRPVVETQPVQADIMGWDDAGYPIF